MFPADAGPSEVLWLKGINLRTTQENRHPKHHLMSGSAVLNTMVWGLGVERSTFTKVTA